MERTEWFKRQFPLIEDNGILPSIIERLSGTPARVEERMSRLEAGLLIRRVGEKWTIKEELGHLSDMEPLWYGRLEDLKSGLTELRVADLTNMRTHTAGHNATETDVLLLRFREHRQRFVKALMELNDKQLLHTSSHPRLKTPMRIIDLAYFVAEHDDHHLAAIREISG
jgi:uncharacterized damage-inducible protein DinB